MKTSHVLWPTLLALLSLPLPAQERTRAQEDAAQKAIRAFFRPKPQSDSAPSRLLGTLADPRLTEASGLAASRRTAGVLWTHNDSGDGPYLYALDMRGRTLARFTVTDATHVDWEDLAAGPGADGKPALYIGDIGDNNRSRTDTAIYRVPEPVVDTKRQNQEEKTAPAEKFPYRYPDGAHDCETLLAHPTTGEVFLVTKSANGQSGVYAFPLPLTPDKTVTLRKVGTITFDSALFTGRMADAERMATGGDFAPNGKQFVLRTYVAAYLWKLDAGQTLAEALKTRPRRLFLPLSQQGEAICFRADSKALLITSEGKNAPLYEVPLP